MQDSRLCLTARQAFEWRDAHFMLRDLLLDLLALWPDTRMDVTCIGRTAAEEAAAGGRSGIHVAGPNWRAADVRIRALPGNFQEKADGLAADLNRVWQYDPARPEKRVAVAELHGSGPHIHLQVCPATRKRGPRDTLGA